MSTEIAPIAAAAATNTSMVDRMSAMQESLAAFTNSHGLAQQGQEQANFATIMSESLQSIETKVEHANDMVRQFTVDETVPIHQVTIALEEARLGVELAMQVRSRLVEGYREIMNMQL